MSSRHLPPLAYLENCVHKGGSSLYKFRLFQDSSHFPGTLHLLDYM